MSIPRFSEVDKPSSCLTVHVDMSGRAYSGGNPDCNGYEIFDIIDACEYVKKHYSEYDLDLGNIGFVGNAIGRIIKNF